MASNFFHKRCFANSNAGRLWWSDHPKNGGFTWKLSAVCVLTSWNWFLRYAEKDVVWNKFQTSIFHVKNEEIELNIMNLHSKKQTQIYSTTSPWFHNSNPPDSKPFIFADFKSSQTFQKPQLHQRFWTKSQRDQTNRNSAIVKHHIKSSPRPQNRLRHKNLRIKEFPPRCFFFETTSWATDKKGRRPDTEPMKYWLLASCWGQKLSTFKKIFLVTCIEEWTSNLINQQTQQVGKKCSFASLRLFTGVEW